MNIFQLRWVDYDESTFWLLSHNYKIQDDFNTDVEFLLKKYGEEYITHEKSWTGACHWMEYIVPKLEELGYEKVEPIKWSFSGASIIGYNEESITEDDFNWSEIVGKDLLYLAAKHNKDLEDSLYK